MRKKPIHLLLIALCLVALLLSTSLSVAQPFIGEDDKYEKNIELGTTNQFYWTIYRNDTSDYAISVDVQGLNRWSYEITPAQFVLSEKNSYEIVTMSVSIPQFPDVEKQNASVVYTYRQLNSTEKNEIIKTVTITVVGVSSGGQENTILGGFSNPLPPPLNNPYGALIINILLWFVIAFVLYFIIQYVIHTLVKKTKTKLDDAIVDILRKPIIVVVIIYGVITSVIRLGIQIGIRESLFQIFSFIVLGIVIYVLYKIFDEIIEEVTLRKGGHSSAFGKVLRPLFRIIGAVVIIVGGLIYGLGLLGIQVTALLAGAGVFGLVIAFAAQDTLSNFFSGMHLLLDQPFRIGDLILLESGEYCRVESVGMRSTKLYSLFDHELLILPNNSMASQKIINIVRPDTKIRQRVEVGVAYGSDVDLVKKILYEAASNHQDVLTDEEYAPLVRFTGFGDSSLDFLLIFTIDDVMKQWRVRSEVVSEIDAQFRKAKITIPFPQRTVWFHEISGNSINKKRKK